MWPRAGSEAEAPHCANRPLEEARSRSARDKHEQEITVRKSRSVTPRAEEAENNSRHTGQRLEAGSQDKAILVVFPLNVATLPHQVPALLPPPEQNRVSTYTFSRGSWRTGAQLLPRSLLRPETPREACAMARC